MDSLSKRSTTAARGLEPVTVAIQASVQSVMADETTSDWLRTALNGALQRDPVDSLNDALLLAGLLEERLRVLLKLWEIEQTSKK